MEAAPIHKVNQVTPPAQDWMKGLLRLVVDSETLFLKAFVQQHARQQQRRSNSYPLRRSRPRKERVRVRRSVEDIYNCLGPTYFRRAYRMSYESFLVLHGKTHEGIKLAEKKARAIVRALRFKGPHFLISAATGAGTKELSDAVMRFLEAAQRAPADA